MGFLSDYWSIGETLALPFFLPLGFIGIFRWLQFLIRCILYSRYRPVHPTVSGNKYINRNATVIIPTIDESPALPEAIRCWIRNRVSEVIVVTSRQKLQSLADFLDSVLDEHENVRVIAVNHPNKRTQLVCGINHCFTDICVLADDDSLVPDTFLEWMLAPFNQDPNMGGVGSAQHMKPTNIDNPTFYEVLADMRLSLRMMDNGSSTYVDGGISCLSGRTAVYKHSILADSYFQREFLAETWNGSAHLHSGDDKFITRWLVTKGLNMRYQQHSQCTLETYFKPDWKFLLQVLRWSRNTWRSDIKSLREGSIFRRHPYVAFCMVDKMISPITLFYGPVALVYIALTHPTFSTIQVFAAFGIWLLVSRGLKLTVHFRRNPSHLIYLPVFILFTYGSALIKLYALGTLSNTGWGTRKTIESEMSTSISRRRRVKTKDTEIVDMFEQLSRYEVSTAVQSETLDISEPLSELSSADSEDSRTFTHVSPAIENDELTLEKRESDEIDDFHLELELTHDDSAGQKASVSDAASVQDEAKSIGAGSLHSAVLSIRQGSRASNKTNIHDSNREVLEVDSSSDDEEISQNDRLEEIRAPVEPSLSVPIHSMYTAEGY